MESLQERIAKRAYELFLARGGQHGYHIEDWAQAEKEVKAEEEKLSKGKEVKEKQKPVEKASKAEEKKDEAVTEAPKKKTKVTGAAAPAKKRAVKKKAE